jgi:hypothetical protein
MMTYFLHMIVSCTTVPLSLAATIRPIFVTEMSANSVIIPDIFYDDLFFAHDRQLYHGTSVASCHYLPHFRHWNVYNMMSANSSLSSGQWLAIVSFHQLNS